MKTLTLNKTWTLTLRMWRWIVKQAKEVNYSVNVSCLKRQWLNDNGFDDYIHSSCFFCEYSINNDTKNMGCTKCPGRLVDRKFSCLHKKYDYQDPQLFYTQLLRLNKLRKEAVKLKIANTKKRKRA